MSEDKNDNLIKRVSKELNLTYKELGEKIGFTEGGIKNSISSGKISRQMEKSLLLLLKVAKLEKEVSKATKFKQDLKELLVKNYFSN